MALPLAGQNGVKDFGGRLADPYKNFAITAVRLAAIVMATPIFKQVSAKLRFALGGAAKEKPQPSQAPRSLLIFLH